MGSTRIPGIRIPGILPAARIGAAATTARGAAAAQTSQSMDGDRGPVGRAVRAGAARPAADRRRLSRTLWLTSWWTRTHPPPRSIATRRLAPRV